MPESSNPSNKFTIYETINLVNGRKYIGKHITPDPEDDYLGSGVVLLRAIKKHGRENFKKTVLFVFDNEEEMDAKERDLITLDIVKNGQYYNIATGGQGGQIVLREGHPLYEKTCEKISQAKKERSDSISDMVKELHQEKKCGMHGKKHSEETKAKMSATTKGKPKPHLRDRERSPETRAKIAAAKKGKKFTPEHRAAIAKNHWRKKKES